MVSHGGKRRGAGRKPGIPNNSKLKLVELIKEQSISRAINVLEQALNSKNERIRLNAATYLIDQKFGKPGIRKEAAEVNEVVVTVRDFSDKSIVKELDEQYSK